MMTLAKASAMVTVEARARAWWGGGSGGRQRRRGRWWRGHSMVVAEWQHSTTEINYSKAMARGR